MILTWLLHHRPYGRVHQKFLCLTHQQPRHGQLWAPLCCKSFHSLKQQHQACYPWPILKVRETRKRDESEAPLPWIRRRREVHESNPLLLRQVWSNMYKHEPSRLEIIHTDRVLLTWHISYVWLGLLTVNPCRIWFTPMIGTFFCFLGSLYKKMLCTSLAFGNFSLHGWHVPTRARWNL